MWDIRGGYVTHVFKGHGGVVSALAFNFPRDPSSVTRDSKMQLITACVDTQIRIFDLAAAASKGAGTLKPEAVLEGHVSVPRGLDVSEDGKWLISGGRDSVILVWRLLSKESSKNTKKGKGKEKELSPILAKTIPALERVEALGLLHLDEIGPGADPNKIYLYTAGEKGVVKVWDGLEGNTLFILGEEQSRVSNDEEEQRQIVDAMSVFSSFLTPFTSRAVIVMFPPHQQLSRCMQTKMCFSIRWLPGR